MRIYEGCFLRDLVEKWGRWVRFLGLCFDLVILSCILRVYDFNFDIDKFVGECPVEPSSSYKKGQVKIPNHPEKGVYDYSSCSFLVSDTEIGDLAQKLEDVICFIEENEILHRYVESFPGIEDAILNFGIGLHEDLAMKTLEFPSSFLKLVATTRYSLNSSIYVISD
jgi:hypothetical protein